MIHSSRLRVSIRHLALFIVLSAIALVSMLQLVTAAGRSGNPSPLAHAPAGTHGPYSTSFSKAESPLSEGGIWLNGRADGLDWTDAHTTPGFVFGTEYGGKRPAPQKYDDTVALLKGNWGPNQTLQATVRSVNPAQDGKVLEEVELRLRSTVTPHSSTGYEVMFRCTKIAGAYCNVARWEGPLGKFTMLKESYGSKYGVKTGDVLKATMIGNLLTVYINGVQMVQLSDDKFKTGNPGIGFYLEGATGVNADYGFTHFMATDR